ncbi:putative quercetin 2,3-dioxygenase PA1210 [Ceratocystis fimbriata CBS 114723]|uniref:Putative quercetin 2,3-dioxygenase PA1210 n=1 Tax=Ceratocystis fimbriata CBS 114723 TaxID=1035309 RepID=A0A2C5X8S3_9PEZI|nr:putative quercetin 2,3-dioxygenase PA1210 [Ceratocystis fimbriata CBS 114723]
MRLLSPWSAVLVIFLAIIISTTNYGHTLLDKVTESVASYKSFETTAATTTSTISVSSAFGGSSITPTSTLTSATSPNMSTVSKASNTMSKALRHAKITPHRSSARGHSDHGWLNTYHSFSFADWYNPKFSHFGSLRVLNEDRVKANSGFPTHPHRDFEIFSYILSGELTHRDSMLSKGNEGGESEKFKQMKRGDVQFTTGGTGIAHSEFNEHPSETVHFLQIWAIPWKKGLPPAYHTQAFSEEAKRQAFLPILSPLKAGEDATLAEEKEAVPAIPGTIPIHADFVMGAGIIEPGKIFDWRVGAKVTKGTKRKVYIHVTMTKGGRSKIRLDGREDDDAILGEGDGVFIDNLASDDILNVESIGTAEAEIVVLDTA